jgi:hypothetical protein
MKTVIAPVNPNCCGCQPATERALRAALERLTSGTAKHCDGEITVSNLTREAGVSRGHRQPRNRDHRRLPRTQRRSTQRTMTPKAPSELRSSASRSASFNQRSPLPKRAVRADEDDEPR